mmetsp:Transcript_2445/g.4595  ORF Transcript_2445/g.4595 Transcript_2445/m.4595 type:complete len:529 (+) Transcript_2445:298-1884(+)
MCRGACRSTNRQCSNNLQLALFPEQCADGETHRSSPVNNETKTNGSNNAHIRNDNNKAATPCRDKRRAFLTRSLATRTVSFVESEIESLTSQCRFLKETNVDASNIAKLERSEVVLGKLLGEGGFSEVYTVEGFCLKEDEDEDGMDLDEVLSEQEFNEKQLEARSKLATTYRASHMSQYVVKHLRKDLLSTRSKFHSAAADLVLEAQFLSRIDHPNIIKVRGWSAGGTSSFSSGSHDSYFLLFDRLDETLTDRIEHWRRETVEDNLDGAKSVLPALLHGFVEKLEIAEQLASALKYLHDRKIIYRDLKPDNIGLVEGTKVQLFDFGLVRELPQSIDEDEESSTARRKNDEKKELFHMSGCGTRRYQAPEMFLGEGYNLQVDVFSLTLVLHEMLTHIKPFAVMGPETHRVLVVEGGERPAISNEWPKDLQTLLQQGWGSNPSDRPSMKEFHLQLMKLKVSENLRHKRHNFSPNPSSHVLDDVMGAGQGHPKQNLWHFSLHSLPRLIRKLSVSFSSSTTEELSTFDSFDS